MVLGVAMVVLVVLMQLVRMMVASPMSVVVRDRLHLLFAVARRGHQLLRLDLVAMVMVMMAPVVQALDLAALVQLVVDRG